LRFAARLLVARPQLPPPVNRLEGQDMKKIDIRKLPELNTRVGIHGSSKQKEVGGPLCIAIVLGIIAGSE
jgi:hypothetical protein